MAFVSASAAVAAVLNAAPRTLRNRTANETGRHNKGKKHNKNGMTESHAEKRYGGTEAMPKNGRTRESRQFCGMTLTLPC